VLTSIGTSIDRVDSRGFRVNGRGGMGDNLTMDKGGGWVEVVLGSVEEAERDMD